MKNKNKQEQEQTIEKEKGKRKELKRVLTLQERFEQKAERKATEIEKYIINILDDLPDFEDEDDQYYYFFDTFYNSGYDYRECFRELNEIVYLLDINLEDYYEDEEEDEEDD